MSIRILHSLCTAADKRLHAVVVVVAVAVVAHHGLSSKGVDLLLAGEDA